MIPQLIQSIEQQLKQLDKRKNLALEWKADLLLNYAQLLIGWNNIVIKQEEAIPDWMHKKMALIKEQMEKWITKLEDYQMEVLNNLGKKMDEMKDILTYLKRLHSMKESEREEFIKDKEDPGQAFFRFIDLRFKMECLFFLPEFINNLSTNRIDVLDEKMFNLIDCIVLEKPSFLKRYSEILLGYKKKMGIDYFPNPDQCYELFHLTEDIARKYINYKIGDKEHKTDIEFHLMHCKICQDLVETIRLMEGKQQEEESDFILDVTLEDPKTVKILDFTKEYKSENLQILLGETMNQTITKGLLFNLQSQYALAADSENDIPIIIQEPVQNKEYKISIKIDGQHKNSFTLAILKNDISTREFDGTILKIHSKYTCKSVEYRIDQGFAEVVLNDLGFDFNKILCAEDLYKANLYLQFGDYEAALGKNQ